MVEKHKKKKIVRKRGTKWHGYGAKKKHRGKGSRGGKGNANLDKSKRSYVTTHERDHFGKKGFHSLKKRVAIITLSDLESSKESSFSFDARIKVLANGEIKKPIKLSAWRVSKAAKEKIESAGGSVDIKEESEAMK